MLGFTLLIKELLLPTLILMPLKGQLLSKNGLLLIDIHLRLGIQITLEPLYINPDI